MQIRVLGCSGSIAAGNRTTSFLLDDDILIDAGTGVGDLTLDELARIDHILVSHSHLDHVLAIGLLADSVVRRRMAAARAPIAVHALPETIAALRAHVFNNVIWPDFSCLPDAARPVLRFVPAAVGQVLSFGARRIEVLPASHTVPAVGFAVSAAAATPQPAWVFSGDTGPNPALWARLAHLPVAALVIETAFGNDDLALARISGHLCPALLGDELARLEQPAEVYITHIKPGELDAVMSEIGAQASRHRIRALVAGQVMKLGHENPADVFASSSLK
ncbi:MAG TPA: 3',5'-cyclic-nucleotide phosphodiesterase [Rubrivivax sp.]|mgnify:CR=1 FL=1|nr:3',5'-cyclic-nucleotide phosphodiesterase [Rubrivivax sp.]